MASKQKYCNLYIFIKKNNKDLFSLLEDLCAEQLFKQRYPVTFLNPNKDLVKKLEKMIDNGDQEMALEKLKSLFIYNKHDSLENELVTYNKMKIGNVAELSKLKKSNLFNQWEGKDSISVFEYTLSDFPKEEDKVDKAPIFKRGKGEAVKRVHATNMLMNAYLNSKDIKPVAYKLNSLLQYIKSKDTSLYEKVKLLVDPSVIVSWYLLVQPTKHSNKYIPDAIFNKWCEMYYQLEMPSVEEIKNLFNANDYDNKQLKQIAEKRKSIKEVGLQDTINEVIEAYNKNYLKLLEDELRFRFTDNDVLDKDDINELNMVNWDEPKESLIIFNKVPKNNLLRTELMNIIKSFLKSNAFLYTPFNLNIIEKIKSNISGAGEQGKKTIKILGMSQRDDIVSLTSTINIEALVESLSEEQKKKMMALLQNVVDEDEMEVEMEVEEDSN